MKEKSQGTGQTLEGINKRGLRKDLGRENEEPQDLEPKILHQAPVDEKELDKIEMSCDRW